MKLTVITPIHNERACIGLYLERMKDVLGKLSGLKDWQIVFVNDGSTDNSLEMIQKEQKGDQRIKFISLSRNFGYQAALLAGLREVESELYTIIDVDCEDPPELLEEFYEKIQEGYHLAYGIRSQRQEPALLVWCRKMFYVLNKMVADSNVYLWMAEFSMFRKTVRDAILKPKTTYPFLRTEMAYVGYKAVGLNYQRQKRIAGESHYNIWRMTKFAMAGILAGTTFPLRLILYISFILFVTFIVCAVVVQDFAMIANLSVILGFLYLLMTIPLIGMYLARTYKNIVGRPDYFIDSDQTIL